VGVDAEEASYDLLRGGRACDSAGKHMLWGWAGKHLIGKVRTRMGRGTSDAWGRHHRRDQGKATLHRRRGQVDACAGLVPRPSVLAFFKPSPAGSAGAGSPASPHGSRSMAALRASRRRRVFERRCALAASRRWLGSWPQHKAPRG
jgi:hypothetical protein